MNRLQYAVVTLSVWLFVVSAVPLGILPDVQHAAPSPGMYSSKLLYGETPFMLIDLNAFDLFIFFILKLICAKFEMFI